MTYNPDIHHRRSIRLKEYDYSQVGLYFITMCTYQRVHLFGEIIEGEMILNEAGIIVKKCWLEIPNHFSQMRLEEFVIMPNHVHGIIQIVGANHIRPEIQTKFTTINKIETKQGEYDSPLHPNGTSNTIGSMVRGFKTGVTQWFRANTTTFNVWQRNYHEHIIRNEDAYLKISDYVQTNPQRWQEDCFFEELK